MDTDRMDEADEDMARGDSDTDFGRRLKLARERAGFTQEEFCARAGIPRTSLSSWECGARRPKAENLRVVLETLGLALEDLDPFRRYADPEFRGEQYPEILRLLHDRWDELSPAQQEAVATVVRGFLSDCG